MLPEDSAKSYLQELRRTKFDYPKIKIWMRINSILCLCRKSRIVAKDFDMVFLTVAGERRSLIAISL